MNSERVGGGLGDSLGLSLTYDYSIMLNNIILNDPNIFEINKEDRAILKNLAQKVQEIAHRPIEEEKKKLWYLHNDLKPCRPLVFCDPENGWYEIITPDQIKCKSILARFWEFKLRKEIFWGEQMGDDKVISPCFRVQYVFYETDRGAPKKLIGDGGNGAYTWDPPIKDYAQVSELEYSRIVIDYEKTNRLKNLAMEIMGDHLEIILEGCWWWSLGMTADLIFLIGLEKFYMDMYDNPGGIHSLMSFLQNEKLKKLEFLEENNLLTLNNENIYNGSGGFGFTNDLPSKDFDPAHIKTKDLWGFAESQETVGVSPEMFNEFVFRYQKPLLERFGLNSYGCCEPVDTRWEYIKTIPRLRRVSVSAWANEAKMAEYLGKSYIYSRKVPSSILAERNLDEDYARENIRATLQYAKKCNIELIMKDNHTIGRNPQNVIRWCAIAKQEAESIE